VVLLGVGTQGEAEDQFGRCAPGAVLVCVGIARFAVFAVDPAGATLREVMVSRA
jgi:hypothetical protein